MSTSPPPSSGRKRRRRRRRRREEDDEPSSATSVPPKKGDKKQSTRTEANKVAGRRGGHAAQTKTNRSKASSPLPTKKSDQKLEATAKSGKRTERSQSVASPAKTVGNEERRGRRRRRKRKKSVAEIAAVNDDASNNGDDDNANNTDKKKQGAATELKVSSNAVRSRKQLKGSSNNAKSRKHKQQRSSTFNWESRLDKETLSDIKKIDDNVGEMFESETMFSNRKRKNIRSDLISFMKGLPGLTPPEAFQAKVKQAKAQAKAEENRKQMKEKATMKAIQKALEKNVEGGDSEGEDVGEDELYINGDTGGEDDALDMLIEGMPGESTENDGDDQDESEVPGKKKKRKSKATLREAIEKSKNRRIERLMNAKIRRIPVLYIGNIPFEWKRQDVIKFLAISKEEQAWTRCVEILSGNHKGLGRGFAFCQTKTSEAYEKAIARNGIEIKGRIVVVTPAAREDKPVVRWGRSTLKERRGIDPKEQPKLSGNKKKSKSKTQPVSPSKRSKVGTLKRDIAEAANNLQSNGNNQTEPRKGRRRRRRKMQVKTESKDITSSKNGENTLGIQKETNSTGKQPKDREVVHKKDKVQHHKREAETDPENKKQADKDILNKTRKRRRRRKSSVKSETNENVSPISINDTEKCAKESSPGDNVKTNSVEKSRNNPNSETTDQANDTKTKRRRRRRRRKSSVRTGEDEDISAKNIKTNNDSQGIVSVVDEKANRSGREPEKKVRRRTKRRKVAKAE